MHLGTLGCKAALDKKIEMDLPLTEADGETLDPVADAKALKAFNNNTLAMQALVCALDRNNLNHVMVALQADADWPGGKAHKVWDRLLKKYQPDDITSEVELEKALMNVKLVKGANPETLMDKLAELEAQYRTVIPEPKKKAIVWNAGSGAEYTSVVTTCNDMAFGFHRREATAEELVSAMHRQWRMSAAGMAQDDGDAGIETMGETALSATGSGKFGGKCFICKKSGHKKADCPSKGKASSTETAGAVLNAGGGTKFQGNCNFCDKKGHKEADCWKKFPEKNPYEKKQEKETAAAMVPTELLLCAVTNSMDVAPGDSYMFSDFSLDVPTEVDAGKVKSDNLMSGGEVGIAEFLAARLRAVMNEPGVFVCGRVQEVMDDGLPAVVSGEGGQHTDVIPNVGVHMELDKEETMVTTSVFSETGSRWNEKDLPMIFEDGSRFENERDLSMALIRHPNAGSFMDVDMKTAYETAPVTETTLIIPKQPKWVWQAAREGKPKRKSWRLVAAGDGSIMKVHEKLVVEGTPSGDTSVFEEERGDCGMPQRCGWWAGCGTELCLSATQELTFPNTENLLRSPNIWIGDSGASMHVSFCKDGSTNMRESDGHTHGVAGEAMKFAGLMDIPCVKCDRHGVEEFGLVMKDVNYLENSNFNLFSTTKLLSLGWTMAGDSQALTMTKGNNRLCFDIKVETRRGVVFCAYLKRRAEGEVSGLAIGKPAISIERAHGLLGHCDERRTRATAKHLEWVISTGPMKPCESCATGKARQKNVPTISDGHKAVVPNGRWFHDQSTIKPPDNISGTRRVWDMSVDEFTGCKFTEFYKTKNEYIETYCEALHRWKDRGKPVQIIRQDNAGENKALQSRVQSVDWKMTIAFEYTAPFTPQQNSLVERAFAEIASKARTMLNAANVPLEYRWKLFPEAAITATKLDWLTVITRDNVTKSRIEFYDIGIPRFAKHLRIWGEAGTVKLPKDGKVKPRGVTCVFIGYAANHDGNCYRMWNPDTNMVMMSRDVVFLQRMFFEKETLEATKAEPVVHLPNGDVAAGNDDDIADVEIIGVKNDVMVPTAMAAPAPAAAPAVSAPTAPATAPSATSTTVQVALTQDTTDVDYNNNDKFATVTSRGRRSVIPARYRQETAAVATMQNYFACLDEYDDEEVMLMTEVSNMAIDEISCVGAGLGGGFDNTSELRVMKYEEAINGPDGEAWKAEVEKEHGRMVKNKAWVAVDKADLPPGTIPIDSTWAMKKKSNGTLRGRLNARGFKQIEGVHYDGSSIHAPVTNSATIRIVFVLMLMAMWMGILLDVNGAFLHGEFTDGEQIYMKVPRGMERFYPPNVVLLLLKCIYGLKQAAMAFWKRLLICMRSMGFERSMSDPCLYYKWTDKHGLVIIISWIDDNLIVGSTAAVLEAKAAMMERFECDDCGEVQEYVGCKVVRDGRVLKFTQPVLLQSYSDEFDLPSREYLTPAAAGSVLTVVEAGKELSGTMQTKYRSGVGKLMHMMQYSRPEIYNSVRDLARHMTKAGEEHFVAMLRVMKYCVCTANRGLVLAPVGTWDGHPNSIEFIVSGRSDSDYAKEDSRKSVSGHRVLLNGAPVMFKSGTQRIVALSVCEAELYAGISCAQDMLYVKHVIESLGLKVKLPMKLEMDNKGAVDLANNWSVGGRTRHIGTKIEFLRGYKENGVLEVVWIPGSENEADLFTKNLGGPLFRRFAPVFVGEDEYLSSVSPE